MLVYMTSMRVSVDTFSFSNFVQVVRCSLEHAASVAKTVLASDAVVVEIKEQEPIVPRRKPMKTSGNFTFHN